MKFLKPIHLYLFIIIAFIAYLVIGGASINAGADTDDYQEAASNILTGYHQINSRVPFYPLLVILTNSTNRLQVGLFWLQYILLFASFFAVVAALLRCGINIKLVAIILLIMVSPPVVRPVYIAQTESICLTLCNTLFAIFVLMRNSVIKFVLMAFVMVLLTFTRPSFQLTGLALACWLFYITKNKYLPLAFTIAFLLPVLMFSWYNKAKFGFAGITPAGGWNLTTKTTLFIEEFPDKKIRDILVEGRNQSLVNSPSHTAAMFIWNERQRVIDSLHMSYVDASKYMAKQNMAMIKHNPIRYLSGVLSCTLEYLMPNGVKTNDRNVLKLSYSVLQLAYVFISVVITVFFFACLWLKGLKALTDIDKMMIFVFIIVFTNHLLSVAVEIGNPRYRQPTEVLILLLIPLGLQATKGFKKMFARQQNIGA